MVLDLFKCEGGKNAALSNKDVAILRKFYEEDCVIRAVHNGNVHFATCYSKIRKTDLEIFSGLSLIEVSQDGYRSRIKIATGLASTNSFILDDPDIKKDGKIFFYLIDTKKMTVRGIRWSHLDPKVIESFNKGIEYFASHNVSKEVQRFQEFKGIIH